MLKTAGTAAAVAPAKKRSDEVQKMYRILRSLDRDPAVFQLSFTGLPKSQIKPRTENIAMPLLPKSFSHVCFLIGCLCALAAVQAGVAQAQEALSASSLPTLTNSIGMKLVQIPAGRFSMGSPESEQGRYADEVQHEVTLSKDFYLGVTEVTQAQYQKVMGENPSYFQGDEVQVRSRNHPVELVSWEDAVRFCQVLSDRPEEKAAGRSYRLPTEAEWEYAARAGQSGPYHFGNQVKLLNDFAWNRANSDQPREVKTKQPNAFGLHDMYGNVYEWCSDWYTPDLDRQAGQDPKGPTTGTERVVRGGSFREDAKMMRSAARLSFPPKEARAFFGFRVVMELSEGR